MTATDQDILNTIRDAAIAAGDEIMVVYNSDFDVRTKSDASPVKIGRAHV